MLTTTLAACSGGPPTEAEAARFLDSFRNDPDVAESLADVYALDFSDGVTSCMKREGFDYQDPESLGSARRIGTDYGDDHGRLLVSTVHFSSSILPDEVRGARQGGVGASHANVESDRSPEFSLTLDECEQYAHDYARGRTPDINYIFAMDEVSPGPAWEDVEAAVLRCMAADGYRYPSVGAITTELEQEVTAIEVSHLVRSESNATLRAEGVAALIELQTVELALSASLEACGWFGPTPETADAWKAADEELIDVLTRASSNW